MRKGVKEVVEKENRGRRARGRKEKIKHKKHTRICICVVKVKVHLVSAFNHREGDGISSIVFFVIKIHIFTRTRMHMCCLPPTHICLHVYIVDINMPREKEKERE